MTVTPTDRLDGFDVALWWLLTLAGIGMVVKYFNLHIRIGNTPSGKFGVWIDGSGCALSTPPPVRVGTSTLYRIPIAACRATWARSRQPGLSRDGALPLQTPVHLQDTDCPQYSNTVGLIISNRCTGCRRSGRWAQPFWRSCSTRPEC